MQGTAEFIRVSPDGTKYAVGVHRRVDIYSIETAGVEYTIDLKVEIVGYWIVRKDMGRLTFKWNSILSNI